MNIGDKYYVCVNGVTEERTATAEDVEAEAAEIENIKADDAGVDADAADSSIKALIRRISLLEKAFAKFAGGNAG